MKSKLDIICEAPNSAASVNSNREKTLSLLLIQNQPVNPPVQWATYNLISRRCSGLAIRSDMLRNCIETVPKDFTLVSGGSN